MVKVQRGNRWQVTDALDRLDQEIKQFYQLTYGSEEEAGEGHPDLFDDWRGGMMIATIDGELAGIAGWTDIDYLDYGTLDQPRPQLPEVRIAELKRMFVRKQFRGRGVGAALEAALMREVFVNTDFRWIVAETGDRQASSRHMYSKPPYVSIAPFGAFANESGSLYCAVSKERWEEHVG